MRLRRATRLLALLSGIAALSAAPVAQSNPPVSAQRTAPAIDPHVADEMLALARVGADDVVYDVGSIATIPIAAARRFGARAVGVGLDAEQAARARASARESAVDRQVRFLDGELLTAKYADATVVTLDLTPNLNLLLEPILRRDLRPGARIVSHRYGIGAWRADEVKEASDGTRLYLWTVPRRPAHAPDIFFVPTEQRVVEQMLDLAGVTGADVVCDLGSGDGRIPVLAAQRHGARGVGIELDPELVRISRQGAREAGVDDKVRFVEADLFEADITEATVVTLFLSPQVNRRLEAKLKNELRAGTRVVSHQFDIAGWTPDRVITAADGTSLYLWTIKRP